MRTAGHILAVLVCFAAVLFMAGCSSDEPADLISQEEFIPILKDLQVAYAGVDVTVPSAKERKERYKEMNQLVLRKYSMPSDRFYTSYKYYQTKPVLMDSIYLKIIASLNEEIVPLQKKQRERQGAMPEAR